jgi:thiamine phosphate synthase YjbQ (UPF0047 family)
MIFLRNYFLNTTDRIDVLSIIHEVNRTIRESTIKDGMVLVTIPQPGGALAILEPLPDIVEKFKEALRVFPGQDQVTKNRRKDEIEVGPRIVAAMLGKSVSLPVKDQRLVIGAREEIVVVDMETSARRREFAVQVMGDGPEPQQQGKVPSQMRRR